MPLTRHYLPRLGTRRRTGARVCHLSEAKGLSSQCEVWGTQCERVWPGEDPREPCPSPTVLTGLKVQRNFFWPKTQPGWQGGLVVSGRETSHLRPVWSCRYRTSARGWPGVAKGLVNPRCTQHRLDWP